MNVQPAIEPEECENCQGHGVYWWLDDEGDERESECEHCKGAPRPTSPKNEAP